MLVVVVLSPQSGFMLAMYTVYFLGSGCTGSHRLVARRDELEVRKGQDQA